MVTKTKHRKAVRKHVRVDRPLAAGTLFPSCALDLDNIKMEFGKMLVRLAAKQVGDF